MSDKIQIASGGGTPPALESISLQVQKVSTSTTSTMKFDMLAPLLARRAKAVGSVLSRVGLRVTSALMGSLVRQKRWATRHFIHDKCMTYHNIMIHNKCIQLPRLFSGITTSLADALMKWLPTPPWRMGTTGCGLCICPMAAW